MLSSGGLRTRSPAYGQRPTVIMATCWLLRRPRGPRPGAVEHRGYACLLRLPLPAVSTCVRLLGPPSVPSVAPMAPQSWPALRPLPLLTLPGLCPQPSLSHALSFSPSLPLSSRFSRTPGPPVPPGPEAWGRAPGPRAPRHGTAAWSALCVARAKTSCVSADAVAPTPPLCGCPRSRRKVLFLCYGSWVGGIRASRVWSQPSVLSSTPWSPSVGVSFPLWGVLYLIVLNPNPNPKP